MTTRKPATTNRTVDRALDVLFALLHSERPLGLGEVGAACRLAPSTTHRLLSSLVGRNLATQDPDTGHYRLGLGLLAFAHAILNRLDVREAATPALNELAELTRETIHLAVLDDLELVYVDRRDTPYAIRLNTSIGRRTTPHTTGVGKALLAFAAPGVLERYLERVPLTPKTRRSITSPQQLVRELCRTRERGYALDDQEDKPHIRCIGAPVLGADGHAVAAVSISVPDSRHTLASLQRWAPDLLQRTRNVSLAMGYRAPGSERG
ncbi:MAG: IclR family transcriptional regulator [Deinococcales bacterium]